jgi:hypothetical protein
MVHVGQYEGNLHNGFILKDVRIKGLPYLPGAPVRIQEIRVHVPLWDLAHSDCAIFNARIFIPDSDPVVFTGRIYAGQISGNLYSSSVDIAQAIRFWASDDIRKNLKGFITNVDLIIQGPLSSPWLSGHFLADNIRYRSMTLTDGSSRLRLMLTPFKDHLQMNGEVFVDSGLVNVRKVNLHLSQSKFIFRGDIFNPTTDIRMGARVEDMDIHLAVKGTMANPQLIVSSDPPMASQDALQILFTGNALASSTSPFNGVNSSELAQDFLNYSVHDINDDQHLGVKTKLTDNLKLGAEMDQMPASPGETNIYYSRKITGEMDMTEHTSLNISQEVLPQDSYPSSSFQDTQPSPETQVYLQYKKRF